MSRCTELGGAGGSGSNTKVSRFVSRFVGRTWAFVEAEVFRVELDHELNTIGRNDDFGTLPGGGGGSGGSGGSGGNGGGGHSERIPSTIRRPGVARHVSRLGELFDLDENIVVIDTVVHSRMCLHDILGPSRLVGV